MFLFASCSVSPKYIVNEGLVFGTYYRIVYESGKDYHMQIKELLSNFNSSMSTFDSLSLISRINKNDTSVRVNDYFVHLMDVGNRITEETNGAFDMTVAPLVNAWGFGFENRAAISQSLIDSLCLLVGMNNILVEGDKIIKKKEDCMLDASAIAKGYGVDIVADFLSDKGVFNYLVEIGGEISCSGVNSRNDHWRIGIDAPIEDSLAEHREIQLIVQLSGQALATSGNYRNYYIQGDKKYAHTIDPRTGYPVDHSLLSASIIGSTCMEADAYATACMVLGLEDSKDLISNLPNVEACFIYNTDEGDRVYLTDGFSSFVVE